MPDPCDKDQVSFMVYTVKNSIVITQHLAMFSLFSGIARSNVWECP